MISLDERDDLSSEWRELPIALTVQTSTQDPTQGAQIAKRKRSVSAAHALRLGPYVPPAFNLQLSKLKRVKTATTNRLTTVTTTGRLLAAQRVKASTCSKFEPTLSDIKDANRGGPWRRHEQSRRSEEKFDLESVQFTFMYMKFFSELQCSQLVFSLALEVLTQVIAN